MKLSYLQSYPLATISAVLVSFPLGISTYEATAAEQISKSSGTVQTYRQTKLNIELCVQSSAINGIESFSLYHNKRLVFHKSLTANFKDGGSMRLAFPYINNGTKPVRTFDGGIDDFIPARAKLAATPFIDFNGDGFPELIVDQSCGNANSKFKVYSLRKYGAELATLSTTRSSAEFMDIDQDGRCEAIAYDPTFFGWKTSNAHSPMPLVILRMNHNRFGLAVELMRTEPPTPKRQQEMLSAWRNACKPNLASITRSNEIVQPLQNAFCLPPIVWADMLNQIYTGNSTLAFSLLNEFWSPSCYATNLEVNDHCTEIRTSKELFEKMFLQQLSRSKYLDELKQLNRCDTRIQNLAPDFRTRAIRL